MNKHLQNLIDLSDIDKAIDSFGPKIEKIKEDLTKVLATKDELNNKKDELENSIKEDELKISKNDLHLKELSTKLEEIATKSANVKTEKEAKALSLEEEIAKEQISFANDEIERLDKLKDSKRDNIVELEKELESIEEEVKEQEDKVSVILEDVEKERTEVFNSKQSLISNMDQKVLAFYQKIRRWANNTTVVEVNKQACYGCFMKLNDKTYAEVIKGEDIVTCPHCGRVIYYKADSEE
jgi:predicted  nucleic acid-binding Zn-ribbon protein